MTDEAMLGLATTEEMLRELICRFRMTQYVSQASGVRVESVVAFDRAVMLAEFLGGLDQRTREYRTVEE